MKKSYIFDFDYTLADSSRGVIECIKYALIKMNLRQNYNDETIKKTIGLSLKDTLYKLTKINNNKEIKLFEKLFIKKADEVMSDLTEIFKDVPEKLKEFKLKDIKIGIVSTKFRYRIENILNKKNLTDYVDIIIGGEDVINTKPDPEGLLKAIDKLNIKKNNTYYIGDSIIDAQTSKNAEINFIASLTGVTAKKEFKNFKVYRFIESINDLK